MYVILQYNVYCIRKYIYVEHTMTMSENQAIILLSDYEISR